MKRERRGGGAGALCSLEVDPPKKVRKKCPKHKRVESATVRYYYDCVRIFWKCGVIGDPHEGEWWDRQSP